MKTPEYKEYTLPPSANEYIFDISGLPMILCSKIREEKDIVNSVKTTYLPVNLEMGLIEERYKGGGVSRRSDPDEWLRIKLQQYLSLDKDNIVIFDHADAKPNYPWIKKKNVPINVFNQEVYFTLYSNQADDLEAIENTIKNSSTASRLFGVMSSLKDEHLPLARNLDERIIQMIVNNTKHLIVSAFDFEGYIICSFK